MCTLYFLLTPSFHYFPGLPSTIAPVPPPARLSPLLTAPHHTLTSAKVLPSRAPIHHCSSSTSCTSFSLAHSTTSHTNICQGPSFQGSHPPLLQFHLQHVFLPLGTAPHHTLTSTKVLPSRAPLHHCSSSTSCTSFSLWAQHHITH